MDISPIDLRTRQGDHGSLRKCFEAVDKEMKIRLADVQFFIKEGNIYRMYTLRSKKQMEQLVVPSGLRHFVMKMAHEGILAEHEGIKRTSDRVLEEFY